MTIIDEVAAKLRGAQRAVKKARATYENAAADAADARQELARREARVTELESALSLLRNGLNTQRPEIGGGNVTPLKRS
jgi:predicted  nucleic acid-binding Zn-ribbon protein